jgi:hypothetical protein
MGDKTVSDICNSIDFKDPSNEFLAPIGAIGTIGTAGFNN